MQKTLFVTGAITDSSAYNATRHDNGDLEGVGTMRWVGNKLYMWVQNRHSAALAAGDVVFHTYSDTTDARKWVRDGATADLGFMAGVVVSTAIAVGDTTPTVNYSNGGYGWIMILGEYATVATLQDGTTAIAAGHVGYGANAALTLTWGTAMGVVPVYTRHMMFLEALASAETPAAGTSKCWVSCLT